ncbi:MAG: hypothetical protein ACYTHN_24750, partial [Planctomycetota bacterium]
MKRSLPLWVFLLLTGAGSAGLAASTKTTLLRYKGTFSNESTVRGKKTSLSGTYTSMHCLSSKGKAGYEGRLFSVQKITKKET